MPSGLTTASRRRLAATICCSAVSANAVSAIARRSDGQTGHGRRIGRLRAEVGTVNYGEQPGAGHDQDGVHVIVGEELTNVAMPRRHWVSLAEHCNGPMVAAFSGCSSVADRKTRAAPRIDHQLGTEAELSPLPGDVRRYSV